MLGVFLLFMQVFVGGSAMLETDTAEEAAPQTAYEFYLSGNAFFHEGDLDQAINAFRKAVEGAPGDGYAHANLGVALAKSGKFEEAIEEFTLCIDKRYGSGTDRFVFYSNRVLALESHGQAKAARRDRMALKKLGLEWTGQMEPCPDYVLMDTSYIEKRNKADRDRFFEEHAASLEKGKIIVRKVPGVDKHTEEYEALGLIEGTLEEVSCVLENYERYPEFVPNVKEMIVADLPNGNVAVDWQLQLPMGFIKRYRLECWVKYEPNRVQRFWKKMPWPGLEPKETIVDTYGQWILETCPGQDNRILAYYRLCTDPGDVPFGMGWIVDMLTEQSVPDIIKQTRKRVEDLFH